MIENRQATVYCDDVTEVVYRLSSDLRLLRYNDLVTLRTIRLYHSHSHSLIVFTLPRPLLTTSFLFVTYLVPFFPYLILSHPFFFFFFLNNRPPPKFSPFPLPAPFPI